MIVLSHGKSSYLLISPTAYELTSRAAGQKDGQINRERNFIKEKEEWILILKKIIGQDQQDCQDNAAFGRKALAAGEKIPVNPVNPV